MVRFTITDDEGIRGICAGPIVFLGNPIDFLALVFPGRKEIA